MRGAESGERKTSLRRLAYPTACKGQSHATEDTVSGKEEINHERGIEHAESEEAL